MNTPKILIVDDEPSVVNSLGRALRKDNYEILRATSGAEALEILRQFQIDLIICDLKMPEMSGIILLKKAKEESPDTIRIILTGQADIKTTIAAINEVGIYRFLTKPWNSYELKITIQNAIQYKILKMENEKLLQKIKAQSETLVSLEKKYPGITSLPKTEDGKIIIEENDSATLDSCLRQKDYQK